MDSQGTSLNEALATTRDCASVRTLIRVNSVMPLQVRLAVEALYPKCQPPKGSRRKKYTNLDAFFPVAPEWVGRRLVLDKF
jgi:hypothetical protein